jgi:pimeloyl-ACP methyl ester carboxylesterase
MKSTTELHKKITKINGINLSYKQGGEGDPLVLLHGFGTSSATWNSVLHLFGNGNSYYLVDLPGHGDSGRESADVYSVTYLADLISEFVLSLELQHYTMIGHSLGGIIALRFALNNYASKIIDSND